MKLDLNVNGKAVSVDVPPDMPLLWVLRDELKLRGTKFGCGAGQCGACTVHLRGRAVRSCQVKASAAAGAPVVTIEGLSPTGAHPLQQIWKEIDVPECGYCQAGQIMSAAALLATTPDPTDAQIDAAMNGNICRCGTYLRIRQGIHRAAAIANGSRTRINERAAASESAERSGALGDPTSDAVGVPAGAKPLGLA
jgi:isoquinoline 1-oxidoreductase subunit alpha